MRCLMCVGGIIRVLVAGIGISPPLAAGISLGLAAGISLDWVADSLSRLENSVPHMQIKTGKFRALSSLIFSRPIIVVLRRKYC